MIQLCACSLYLQSLARMYLTCDLLSMTPETTGGVRGGLSWASSDLCGTHPGGGKCLGQLDSCRSGDLLRET